MKKILPEKMHKFMLILHTCVKILTKTELFHRDGA